MMGNILLHDNYCCLVTLPRLSHGWTSTIDTDRHIGRLVSRCRPQVSSISPDRDSSYPTISPHYKVTSHPFEGHASRVTASACSSRYQTPSKRLQHPTFVPVYAMHLLYKALLFLLLCLLPLQATLHSSTPNTILEIIQDSTIKVFHAATRSFSTALLAKMPLVIPGIQNTDGGNSEDWQTKLMGKKLGDNHDEIVSPLIIIPLISPLFLCVKSTYPSPPNPFPSPPLVIPHTFL